MDFKNVGVASGARTGDEQAFMKSPEYITLTRTLDRYQYLILQISTGREKLDIQLAPLQAKLQSELHNPLPFHRMQWLKTIESVRSRLIKLEQSAQQIKIQRVKKDVARHLAQKRLLIRKLRNRIEEMGREAESSRSPQAPHIWQRDGEGESMYDVLQQIRADKRRRLGADGVQVNNQIADQQALDVSINSEQSNDRDQLLGVKSTARRRHGLPNETLAVEHAKTSGYSKPDGIEEVLAYQSKGQEEITSSMLDMAKQLRQSQEQLHASLGQDDKDLIDRAAEALEQNSTAMNLASRGMKTLQRMSESENWFQRLKLQLVIVAMWAAAILLVFAGPKLRF